MAYLELLELDSSSVDRFFFLAMASHLTTEQEGVGDDKQRQLPPSRGYVPYGILCIIINKGGRDEME